MSALFLNIVNMSISAGWLVLAVVLLRVVSKKAPKWVSVLLWGFVAIRLICPFSIESIFSLIPSVETVSPEIMMDWTPELTTGIDSLDTVINPVITDSFAPNPGTSMNPLQFWIPLAAFVWLIGIAVMLIYTAVSYFRLQRKVATAVLLNDRIYQSEYVNSPFVLGLIRPRIYLPYQMDGDDLHHVLAHEQAHIQRKDHWWKPLGFLLLALHWFNPLMWLGYILLCRDIELACDEKVIKTMDSNTKADYSQALLSCSVHRRNIAACPLAFGEVGVKARVKSVLNYKKPAFWIIVASVITCIVVAVCFLTNPVPNTLRHIEFEDLGAATEEEVWVSNGQWHTYVGRLPAETVQEVYDLPISDYEISQSRSEDRDMTHTLILCDQNLQKPQMSYLLGMYIHFNEDFTQVWVDDGVKPTLSYRVLKPERAQALYQRIQGNRSGMNLLPQEPILGNLQTYYKNADGTWRCDGYNYKYRLEITGQMPNTNTISTFVYLSNLESISFERAWLAAGLSSYSGDYFKPEEATLVEWNSKTVASTNAVSDVPVVVARDYLGGSIAKLLHFGYTVDREGQTLIACGNGPDEGEYGLENTLVLDGKHGQNQILLVPRDAVLKHYCIYAVDGGVYDDGNGRANRVMQTENGVYMATLIEPGEYIYGLELSWPELGITATYGLKVVMTGEESELDRAIESILYTYAQESELIEVKLVDQYTLANSALSSARYLFRVQRASDTAPTWVEVEKSTGKITGEKDDPEKWLVDPPYANVQPAQQKAYGGILDSVSFDIDGDGKEEMCTLGVGPTYGVFSFTFIASPLEVTASSPKYSEVYVLRSAYHLSFEIGDDELRIRGEGAGKTVYFDTAVWDGHILLQCEEEGVFLE